MNKLKPCPFCGSTEIKMLKCHARWGFGWHLTCSRCLSVGSTAYSDRVGRNAETPEEQEQAMKDYAIAAWNRRPAPRKLGKEELRGMVGQWVWVQVKYPNGSTLDGWAFMATPSVCGYFEKMLDTKDYGTTWRAYTDRKQEADTPCWCNDCGTGKADDHGIVCENSASEYFNEYVGTYDSCEQCRRRGPKED